MLRTIRVDPIITNLIAVDEDSIMDEICNSKVDKTKIGIKTAKSKSQNKSKDKNSVKFFLTKSPSFGSKTGFLILKARKVFTEFRQAFIKVPILHHFYPDCYIRIQPNVSVNAISGVFNQLISDNLGRWHLIVLFFKKMILVETRYKTHNSKFLVIVKP